MESIRVYSWKPKSVSNFGDEIGPMIVRELCRRSGLDIEIVPTTEATPAKLLVVGSVLHEACGTDVVWGVGVNSKNRLAFPSNSKISFKAVRGPMTRSVVLDQGLSCPAVYGDPGLLFPMLFDDKIRQRRGELEASCAALGISMPETIFIPNINDDRFLPDYVGSSAFPDVMVVRPNWDPITVAAYISASSRVLSSSLHGLVFADSYGRSTTRVISQYEPEFKYTDYYMGTGRRPSQAYPTIASALQGEESAPLDWDPEPLLQAFPLSSEAIRSTLIIRTPEITPSSGIVVADIDPENTPLLEGWSGPEEGKAWTIGPWAHLRFVVRGIDPTQPIALRLRIGTLPKGKGTYERLRVVRANVIISSHRIDRGADPQEIEIPIHGTDALGEVSLSFKLENPSSPKQYMDGTDDRLLGIWMSHMSIGELNS